MGNFFDIVIDFVVDIIAECIVNLKEIKAKFMKK